jgi:hypothetical protein
MPIDPKIFDLIRSSDVEERKRGVKALARSEDREALRYLASLYKDDPDPEVRDLALKAGQHIKKRGELSEWGSDQGRGAAKFEDVEIKRDAPKQRNKLPDNPKTKEAKALMDKAIELMMQSNYAEAQDLAYQAFELAPNLDTESYYATLASDIMGLPQAQAIAALREGRADYEVGGRKSKRKRGSAKEVSWVDFLVDSAILYVVSAGSLLFFMVMIFNQVQVLAELGYLSDLTSGSEYAAYGGVDPTAQFMGFLSSSGMTLAIIIGLIGGLVLVLANLLHFVILHFCAGMLGGDGSFRALVHNSIIPLVVQSLASVIISGAIYYLTIQDMIQSGGANSLSRDTLGIVNTLNSMSSLVGFGYLLWLSFIVGKTYDFGFGKGCGALIISFIAYILSFVAIGFCGGFLFGMMAATA